MVRVPYKAFPDKYATFLYSAMLPVHLALPHPNAPRTKRFEAVIDSGASRCIFHADIGRFLGLDMKKGATAKHLAAYLDEMTFRFNNRDNPYLFRDTLLKLIEAPVLAYKTLTAA
jgi:hypothetical protein